MRINGPEPESKIRMWIFFWVGLAMGIPAYFYLTRPAPLFYLETSNFLGSPEIYSADKEAWIPAQRGAVLAQGDRLRTDNDSELDLKIPGKFSLRVKPNSEVEVSHDALFSVRKANEYGLRLTQGSILGSTGKDFKGARLKIETPICVAAVRGTLFRITHHPQEEKTRVGVLQGSLTVHKKQLLGSDSLRLANLETAEITPSEMPRRPEPISQEDWESIKEAYELIEREAAFEEIQQDLSKQAGNLFEKVFDHGTFYMPKVGYAAREFVSDPLTHLIHLNAEYDVFPRGSFVGLYFKTRDFDLSQYEGMSFQARRVPGQDYPDGFRIEMKSKGSIARAFSPRTFKKDWRPFEFKFSATKPTEITEITFVFAHEKAGEHKKGALQFREFQLIPKTVGSPSTEISESATGEPS